MGWLCFAGTLKARNCCFSFCSFREGAFKLTRFCLEEPSNLIVAVPVFWTGTSHLIDGCCVCSFWGEGPSKHTVLWQGKRLGAARGKRANPAAFRAGIRHSSSKSGSPANLLKRGAVMKVVLGIRFSSWNPAFQLEKRIPGQSPEKGGRDEGSARKADP